MGVFDSAAATISSVSSGVGNAVTSLGPATGLSSTFDSVKQAFSGAGTLFKKLKGSKFPLPNPLFAYASYTYSIGLACINEDECNFPDKTYMAGKPFTALICKSGGAEPNNRIKTPYGKFDFFIDNIVLEQTIGFANDSNNTNVTNFTFTITEPYSMGMFMISLQQAAQNQKHDNWRDAPFVLSIEFRGNKETGTMAKIPGTTRFIPFKFSDISLQANEGGSTYKCSCYATSQESLLTHNALFKKDVAPAGKTVQEILQTGERSLQKIINDGYQELVTKKVVEFPDQVVILFPTAIESNSSTAPESSKGETKSSATVTTADEKVFKNLGVTQSTINQTLIQQADAVNAIGAAKLGFDERRKGTPTTGKENVVYNTKTSTWERGNMTSDPTRVEMKFAQDTDIANAINQVLLLSNYSSDALDPANITSEGYRNWWRIDTQVYYLGGKENKATGTKPKLFVYRVIPYHVHSSRMMPPNVPAPGIKNGALKSGVVKQYQYIYTGKNVDILSFNIEMNQGFAQIMAADNLTRTEDKITSSNTGGTDKGPEGDTSPMPKGNVPPKTLGTTPTQTRYAATDTSTSKKGGAGPGSETPAVRAARLFQDCVTNPNEMYTLKMEIMGDPYWIAQSGTGNYTSAPVDENLNNDGSVNYQTGEVDIIVNFRTPIDINQSTGLYNFGGQSKTAPVIQFSGFYQITQLTSTFAGGTFKQRLEGFRRPGQGLSEAEERAQLFTTKNPPAVDASKVKDPDKY